jgi:hypothetical protein
VQGPSSRGKGKELSMPPRSRSLAVSSIIQFGQNENIRSGVSRMNRSYVYSLRARRH